MAGTDPHGLFFGEYWKDFKQGLDYFFGDRRAKADRILRENQRLVDRHLQEQLELGLISATDHRWFSYEMRTDIDQALLAMEVIECEQGIETEIQITISLIPVGDVAAADVNGVRAIRTAVAARNAGAATAAEVRVASGLGGEILPASIVRPIGRGEKVDGLIRELAEATYESGGLEHAIVSLKDGSRVIVRGGSGGIALGGDVRRVIIHAHPRTTGPPPADFDMLRKLGQPHSYIYELFGGGLSRFGS
jgi:hypothetical protein